MKSTVYATEVRRPVSSDDTEIVAKRKNAAGRNAALDFVKGTLVLFMIAYHSFNYFHHDKDILKYLHFLPPSFIFITGFLITNVYLAKYDAGDWRLFRRLIVRGAKLLVIFLALNLAAHSLVHANYNQREMGLDFFIDNLDTVFLSGEGKVAVFDVLLPIAYLLILSGVLLKIHAVSRSLLPAITAATVGVCLYLSLWGHLVFNLELLSMGVLGLATGLIPLPRVEKVANQVVLLSVIYAGYAALVTFYYPIYPINIFGVALTLTLLYGAGLKLGNGAVMNRIIRLGQYSLVAYIFQIGILQVLFRCLNSMPRLSSTGIRLAIVLTLTPLITVAVIEALDYARRKSELMNRAYKIVFA